MRKLLLSGLAVATILAGLPTPALSQDKTMVFKPAGQWTADFGDDYCRLMRSFTDGKDTVSLALERVEPGRAMRLVLVSNAIRTFRGADEIGWNFLPTQGERKNRYIRSATSDGQQYLNLGPITFEAVAPPAPGSPPAPPKPYDRDEEKALGKAITGFRFEKGLIDPVEIQTGRLEAPIDVLQACSEDLIKSWGLDIERHKRHVPALADGFGSGWLPQGTVPFSEIGKLGGGSNMVRLMVDAEGKATSCHIHWPTLEKSLNDKICALLMKTAHFTPAKDANGQAMASYWFGSPMFLGPPLPGGRPR